MAPEQFQGDATPATDIFGVGALAVALLTRREPHTMTDWSGRLRWRPHAQLHGELGALIDGMVEPDPLRRLASASVVRQRVTEARLVITEPRRRTFPASEPAPRPRAPAPDRSPGPSGPRPVPVAVVAERPPWPTVFDAFGPAVRLVRRAANGPSHMPRARWLSVRNGVMGGAVLALAMALVVGVLGTIVGSGYSARADEAPPPRASHAAELSVARPTASEASVGVGRDTEAMRNEFLVLPGVESCLRDWSRENTARDRLTVQVTTVEFEGDTWFEFAVPPAQKANAREALYCLATAVDSPDGRRFPAGVVFRLSLV
jgi:hypothetical protein